MLIHGLTLIMETTSKDILRRREVEGEWWWWTKGVHEYNTLKLKEKTLNNKK